MPPSKHGLLGMTRALANEWATDRIRVNAIAPGYMETELTAAHVRTRPRRKTCCAASPSAIGGLPPISPGQRFTSPRDASSHVAGTALSVDGGWLSR